MSIRRLPVYLVLDVSESMAGPAIEAVDKSIQALVAELKKDPHALETAHMSVITFAREAKQIVPLTDIADFVPPKLSVRTGTSLGKALRLLLDCMAREVIRTSDCQKGDYKPLVYLLTDGQPTDDWRPAVEALRRANNPKIANIIAVGCGPDADVEILRQVSETVLLIPTASQESLSRFFVWLSSSVQSASVALERRPDVPFDLPGLPEGVEVPREGEKRDDVPSQLFLHARCSGRRLPYLMRYGYYAAGGYYNPLAAHPLDEFEESDAELLPSINSSLLNGVPRCPHCGNMAAAQCPCGTILCTPEHGGLAVTCPACHASLVEGDSSEAFEVQRVQG
jgi:uncharacterized protein YegL